MRKNIHRHRPELRAKLREFFALVPKGREVTAEMIRDGVNALIPVPAGDDEVRSLIGYFIDRTELKQRLDEDAEKTFYRVV